MRPLAWLKRVGFNHVSKDWRITFFSRAARICSQGLRAEAGEIANAIERILAGATCVLPCEFNRAVKAMAHASSEVIAHPHLLTENMPDGRWSASEKHCEARVEIHSVGRSETFLNGPDGSTFRVRCNPSFT